MKKPSSWNGRKIDIVIDPVVNCFQILYIRSLNTITSLADNSTWWLWIAFRFCIFVLWTQFTFALWPNFQSCELLSDFVYSFFEHNGRAGRDAGRPVVNCFQILYIRSLNTIPFPSAPSPRQLWIAFRFCIFVLWTQWLFPAESWPACCELLSDFVYSFFEHNCT